MDDSTCHPILGGEEEYKKQKLEGTHWPCLLAAIAVTKQSILDLMVSSPCLWICSTFRFRDGHEVMLSVVPACHI